MRELNSKILHLKTRYSQQKTQLRFQQGFTFIELILYISILMIVLTALLPFAWNVVGTGVKSSAQQEVFSQARYVSERISYEIRRASGITTVSTTSISLTNFSPDTTTVISLSGNKIQINKNGTGAVNLNSTDTSITGLTFTDYRSVDNKTENIQFVFTIDDALASSRSEYQSPAITMQGSAEVRSN